MAQSSDLETRICLIWHTEKPFKGEVRKSSDFSMLGSEWHLQMEYCAEIFDAKTRYILSLHQGTKTKKLRDSFQFFISTFVVDEFEFNISPPFSTKTVQSPSEILLEFETNSTSSTVVDNNGDFTVYGIFGGSQLSTLQTKNETMHLWTRTDEEMPGLVYSPRDLESLSRDFDKLLRVICGNRSFFVRKSVLAARSRVFAAMVEREIQKWRPNTIEVTDLDPDILEYILQYVYMDKLPYMSEETASSLYKAGDKYAMPDLKKSCADWMIRGLTKENFIRVLSIADAYKDVALKDAVVSFIKQRL